MATSTEQITRAVERFQAEVPALGKLKLVVGLELTSGGLMGPADSERFRIEVPGPAVSAQAGPDERLLLSMPKTMFGVLADEGGLVDWKEAYFYGHLKVTGDERVKRLLGRAIEGSPPG